MRQRLTILLSLVFIIGTTGIFADNLYREYEKKEEIFRIDGFLQNKGQVGDEFGSSRPDVKYVIEKGNFKLLLKTNSFSYELSHIDYKLTETAMVDYKGLPKFARYKPDLKVISHRVDIEFLNSNPFPAIEEYGASEDYFNYYTHLTPDEGAEEVRTFQRVRYIDIYPRIDVEFKSTSTGIKYDIIVKPGGKLKEIRMKYSGADDIQLLPNGRIKILTSEGFVEESIPASFLSNYSGTSDITQNVNVSYKLENNILSFFTPEYDNQSYLTIDPEIVWGTYYGDVNYDAINAIQNDELNNVIATGLTFSKNNIATSGTYQTTYGGGMYDAFMVKIDHSGKRKWGTYCGGDSLDVAEGVAADNVWHHLYIMGYTASRNGLSSAGSYQETYGGGYFDSFIGKFDIMGKRIWCTYFGGSDASAGMGGEYLFNAAVDERFNEIYIVGVVSSRDSIASKYAHQTTYLGDFDAVLAKFKSDGTRDWATFYGGTKFDGAYGITLDPSGYITIGGYTESNNNIGTEFEEIIATEGAYQFAKSGSSDGFIARFNLRGTRQWGTYFGGPNSDIVNCTAADKDKNIYIGGSTGSTSGISTSGSHQPNKSGTNDGFVAKFSSTGSRLWSTYYGGQRYDEVYGMYCDTKGDMYMTGFTYSKENISTPGSFQPTFIGKDTTFIQSGPEGDVEVNIVNYDGFIVLFNPDGSRQWGTYFGGWEDDIAQSIAIDLNDNILIGGYTNSTSMLTTPGSFQPTYSDTTDGFIMKFGEFVRLTDISTPFCIGNPITIAYETGTEMNSGNVFTAQLSDATGAFSSPVNIGTKTATKDGTIDAVIPKSTTPGTAYRIRIASSNPAKISKDNGYDITINPLPTPVIQGDDPACSGEYTTYIATLAQNVKNKWSVTSGKIIGDSTKQAVVVAWNDISSGKIKVIQTNTVTGCIDSVEKLIKVNISPDPTINGEKEVLSYSTHTYRSPSVSNWNYQWEVSGGAITGTSTLATAEVTWGSVGVGTVKLINTHKTTGCIDSLTINVAINSVPININGKKTVCAESLEKYYINPDTDIAYKWLSTGGVIQGDDTDTLMQIIWGQPGNGVIKLIRINTKTQAKDTIAMNVNIIALPNAYIFGYDENCEEDVVLYYTPDNPDETNEWSAFNGRIEGDITKDSITVYWNKIPQGNDSLVVNATVFLKQTNTKTGCIRVKSKTISLSAKPDVKFVGSNEVCENDISFYFNRTPGSFVSSNWIVGGGTIIGESNKDTLQVNWGPQGTGSVKLVQKAVTDCYDSLEMVISIVDIPEKPTINLSGTKLVSSAEFGNQWFVNGERIEGATNMEYEPDSSGLYSVKVIVSSGCVSPMSSPFNFELIDKKDYAINNEIRIFPNPTTRFVILNINSDIYKEINVQIINLVGKTLYHEDINLLSNELKIDFGDYSTGIYVVVITIDGNKKYFNRVVKH
jgi:hypothetical protein